MNKRTLAESYKDLTSSQGNLPEHFNIFGKPEALDRRAHLPVEAARHRR